MLRFRESDLVSGLYGTSTKGNQRKWRTRDGKYYIKENFFYLDRYWRDDMVEVVASDCKWT